MKIRLTKDILKQFDDNQLNRYNRPKEVWLPKGVYDIKGDFGDRWIIDISTNFQTKMCTLVFKNSVEVLE